MKWKETLEARGLKVSPIPATRFRIDLFSRSNGYPLRSRCGCGLHRLDAKDAEMTLDAAMQLEDERRGQPERLKDIDTVWRRKASWSRNSSRVETW